MLLLSIFQPKKLNYVALILAFLFIGDVKPETNKTLNVEPDENKTPVVLPEQKSVKKQLKVNVTNDAIVKTTPPPSNRNDEHNDKLVNKHENTVTESSGKMLELQTSQQGSEKTSVLETVTKPAHLQHHLNEEFILTDEDDISESLKTGFYFFLILSSGAILFIVYKIYSLRLSRAERKYGVQGDRSTQELTPLPISIEDGHSDDEDHTVFEVQRQNIRIL